MRGWRVAVVSARRADGGVVAAPTPRPEAVGQVAVVVVVRVAAVQDVWDCRAGIDAVLLLLLQGCKHDTNRYEYIFLCSTYIRLLSKNQ